jgi:hypothetical protein
MPKFENTFFEYINSLARYIKAQPLNLGGTTYSGGGLGGPPGGFIGVLPQTRVAYDQTELATLETTGSGISYSGASLVDNLNHIRARITTIEAGNSGVTVLDDNVVVASGILVLNFENADVEYLAPSQVNITITTELNDKFLPSGIYGENLSNQIGASGGTHFFINNPPIYDDSLRVYHNGVRQGSYYHTTDNTDNGFTTTFTVISGDTLFVDYDILVNDTARVITSGVTLAFLQENYYTKIITDGLLAFKSDTSHTHVEDDITDLSHNAVLIQGVPVSSGFPDSGQALIYDGSTYSPTDVSASVKTINQQFIFTVEGSINDAGTGTKPLRIYSHDVNGNATIEEIFIAVNTAPTTTDIQVDILKNGNSIFQVPQYVQISVGNNTAVRNSSFSSTTFTKDDYFQIEIVQTDVAASDLTIHIRFNWSTS